jgi:hypothetical protein
MHYAISLALPVGLMLFFSVLFQRVRAAPPVFPRLARHAGDHEAKPWRVVIVCPAVGTDEARNPFATWYAKTAQRRFSAPETAEVQVGPSGSAGIGTTTPNQALEIDGASSPTLRISQGGSTATYMEILDVGTSGANIEKYSGSGGVFLNLDPIPSDGTSAAWVRMFRNTNSISAAKGILLAKGDGTATYDAQIRVGGGNSYFNASGGNVGIGNTSPSDRLDVNGAIGLTATTSTLPVNGVYSPAANQLALVTSNSAALTITSTGSVGVSLYGPGRRRVQSGAALARRRRIPATRRRRANGRQNSRNTGGGDVHALDIDDCFGVYPRQCSKEVRAFLLLR